MKRPTLVVMVKVPRPGRVKTRLGRDIGMTAAAWWFRHQVRHLLRKLQDPRWHLVLAVAPDAEGMRSRVWPAHLHRWPQGGGDLGARMLRAMRQADGPVCVIGADIPGITKAHIAEAFANLGPNRPVIGPAPDGGYWLIGLRSDARMPRHLFRDVRWSTEHAMADTLTSLGDRPVHFLPELADVDRAGDLPMTIQRARATS